MAPKGRLGVGKGFSSAAPSSFGGFATPSTSNGSLSYLSDPPDLSSISDPNVVVSFKNLLKKDNTTKSKALADLVAYTQAHPHELDGGVEDAVLDAWVQLYPRTSIDNDRRVRELSHTLQFKLLQSARKRMEKRIPKVAGTWLVGSFDRDKPVARATTQGLSAVFTTEEKVTQFWKKCQLQILQYATEAITETPDTLSDERSTKPEDAEAKYYRAIAGGLSLVLGLLQRLSHEDTTKFYTEYETFFSSGPGDSAWSFATADDSRVRQIVYQLLRLCLEKQQALLDPHMPRIAKIITSDALKKPQLGSADELLGVLIELTRLNRELWGTKRSPLSRLRSFIERGSQGGRPSFWDGLDKLLAILPTDSISEGAASEFFKSFRTGISRREEPRTNAPYAWRCYLNAVSRMLDQVDTESRTKLISETVFPLTDNYLFSTERQGEWLTGVQMPVLSLAYSVAAQSKDTQITESLSKEWERLGAAFIARLSTSLPEVSKEFEPSQKRIAEDGKRWFSVVGAIHTSLTAPSSQPIEQQTKDYTEAAAMTVVREAVDVLKRRNFKPFGAAAILLWALKQSPYLFTVENQGLFLSVVPTGSEEEMAKLLSSPSASYIIACIEALGQNHDGDFENLWSATVQSLLQMQGANSQADSYLTKLISIPAAKPVARNSFSLQQHLEKNILACAQSRGGSWDMFDATLAGDVVVESSLRSSASDIIETLGNDNESSMKAIEIILRRRPTIISEDETLHLSLTTKLLSMLEINEPAVSSRASQLRSLLEKHGDVQPSVLSIIQENLERPGPDSLSIETLVQQATATLEAGNTDLEQMLPDTRVWAKELAHFLQGGINPALALTSNIGGACFLSKDDLLLPTTSSRRDSRGLSIPARMAMYTTAILDHGIQIEALSQSFQTELLYLLYLVIELASDQMTLMDANRLFKDLEDPNLLGEVEEFVTSARRIMHGIFAKFQGWRPGAGQCLLDGLVGTLIEQAKALVPTGVYSARALTEIFEAFSDAHGHASAVEDWVVQLDIMKASHATVLPSTAFLTGYGEMLAGSKVVSNLLNRLISDIAGANPPAEKTLQSLVLLNACMPVFELGQLPVANNRLVFAVKQITSWFSRSPEDLGMEVATESCRALQHLFPCVQEVYGPYWEQAIGFCLSLWSHASKDDSERRLPYIHASVKLLSALRKFDEPNDDLVDALDLHADAVFRGLLDLLKLPGSTNSQPREIVDALLCREAASIPLEHLKDLTDIYVLVASESREIQTAGFNLIHRALPAAQEQVSLNVLLEKKQARLPDELTSLLLDAPTLEAFPEEVLVQFPTPIRSYLLSWKLVFDAYEGAAYKVRTDYTEDLKVNGAISPLMEFMFDVLGHSAASPINLDKEGLTVDDIQDYDIKVADSLPEEKNMHWLLIHLFYLTLKFVPGLFKTWFLDCRSKQTRIAIEPWMIKYFSPIIIHDAIAEVQKWSNSQDVSDPDEKELAIKVNYAQREITAAYAIDDGGDEQSASMLVRIKPNYPLDFVDVVGLNRVACSERTWQSWLRVTQGIITISNGAIIDGLSTFRRNVLGALKGHVECAICYSFIAVDRKMPDKKCATCKNLFHRDCLFKWFSSANQNTCPLCRTRMDFVDKKKIKQSVARNEPKTWVAHQDGT
ncbi:hypothetical protein M406DRAFT_61149 [Cryphonectria parasitica EP155]|uniref:E3 ubiquitin-protein ligase listerin n=1 Tax=Cryphonectria parasitica (strain ATCC 38755 / EP155) TaxID=660469 RepID=A0A9P4Y603_CRYP1|nr:uncharacterized protein M406DRAFT_61149 [Cryphonectria parasitica EP155]KAF3767126.1 hypothetical protein M406DRAFT_61149 [Cryphonectria parasitica EP155]